MQIGSIDIVINVWKVSEMLLRWMSVVWHKRKPRTWTSEILWPVEMLDQRKSRNVVAYASQEFNKATPEASSCLTNAKKKTTTAGFAIHKILGLAGEVVTTIKGAFNALYPFRDQLTYQSENLAECGVSFYARWSKSIEDSWKWRWFSRWKLLSHMDWTLMLFRRLRFLT